MHENARWATKHQHGKRAYTSTTTRDICIEAPARHAAAKRCENGRDTAQPHDARNARGLGAETRATHRKTHATQHDDENDHTMTECCSECVDVTAPLAVCCPLHDYRLIHAGRATLNFSRNLDLRLRCRCLTANARFAKFVVAVKVPDLSCNCTI